MKNKIILSVLFVVAVLAFSIGFSKRGNATQVAYEVSIQSETVEKGEEIPVTVTVTGSALMKSIDAYINYDEAMLEFVEAEGDCVTGSTGVLRLSDNFEDGGTQSAAYHLTFRALEVGTATIQVKETFVEEEESHEVNAISQGAAKIKIVKNDKVSKDASLETLEVYPEGLTPAFSKGQDSYSLKVAEDVQELIISAVPSEPDSIVSIEGHDKLTNGKNTVRITVESPSGLVKEYTISVTK